MPFLRRFLVLGLISITAMHSQTPTPPVAPHNDHREVRHGATVLDPYFWLREKSNPEVVKYLEAENVYTGAQTKALKPFEENLALTKKVTDSAHVTLLPLGVGQSCNLHVFFSAFSPSSYTVTLVADDTTPPPPISDPGFTSLMLSVFVVLM